MKSPKSLSTLPIFLSISMLSLQADEDKLGKWTFNEKNLVSSEVDTLLSSLSSLQMNSTAVYNSGNNTSTGGGFRFFNSGNGNWLNGDPGPAVIPDTDDDGYGFGGNNGQDVMFLHRANFASGSASEVGGQYTSFGSPTDIGADDENGDGKAPMSFIVEAGDEDISITGLTFELAGNNTANLSFSLQDPDRPAAFSDMISLHNNETKTQTFESDIFIVEANSSKIFTIALDSGNINSAHTLNQITLHGHVHVPEISSSSLIMGLFVVMSLTASRRLYYKASL